MSALLEVRNLGKNFGSVRALWDVSFDVEAGSIRGVVGGNGAGKTTLLACLTGLQRQDHGAVRLDGREIAGLPAHALAALGIARTFQDAAVVPALTIRENLMLGAHRLATASAVGAILRSRAMRDEEAALRRRAGELAEYLGLGSVVDASADRLDGAARHFLALGIALAAGPRLLLLDEPAAGLGSQDVQLLGEILLGLREAGVAVALVEHNVGLVLAISDRVLVLDSGTVIADSSPDEVMRNAAVRLAYVGGVGAIPG